ncbi:MAG: hypothetical protein LKG27_04940 [Clostridiaceae bacterium]|jgi:hypothetical protein|nr:hypothetical protein [Clostridiaceae bacterium]
MGLAASQARLLSITSRLSDNELRAQLINNKKIRLASESSRASEDYVNALNRAQMMFTNYDSSNAATTQALSFNSLTAYSPYNTQYGIANNNGQLLVSEKDAYNFQNSSSLDDFLSKYGLTKSTSYFDSSKGIGAYQSDGKVVLSYATDASGNKTPETVSDYSADDLKAIYYGRSSAYNPSGESYDTLKSGSTYTNVMGYMQTIAANDEILEADAYKAVKDKLLQTTAEGSKGSSYSLEGIQTNLANSQETLAKCDDTTSKETLASLYSETTDYYTALLKYFSSSNTELKDRIDPDYITRMEKELASNKYFASAVYDSNTSSAFVNNVAHTNTLSGSTYTSKTFQEVSPDFVYSNGSYTLANNGSDSISGTQTSTAITYKETTTTGTNNLQTKSFTANGVTYTVTQDSTGAWTASLPTGATLSVDGGNYKFVYESTPAKNVSTKNGVVVESVPTYSSVTFADLADGVAEGNTTLYNKIADCSMTSELHTTADDRCANVPFAISTYTITNPYTQAQTTTASGVTIATDQNHTHFSATKFDTYYSNSNDTDIKDFYANAIDQLAQLGEDVITYFFKHVPDKIKYDSEKVQKEDVPAYDNNSNNLIKIGTEYTAALTNQMNTIASLAGYVYGVDLFNGNANATFTSDYPYDELKNMVKKDDDGNYVLNEYFIKTGKVDEDDTTIYGKTYNVQSFQSVLDVIELDKVFDVYGDPKTTWVDSDENDSNPDAKVKWYTNLYNRMKDGYATILDGIAKSTDWMEYAFESGLVTMEQVNSSNEWTSVTYSNCSSITEQTNDLAVTKAEAEYKTATNKIQAKDQKYDMELKNIDTEHNSLQTEYESIKTAIDKNVERSFKIFS